MWELILKKAVVVKINFFFKKANNKGDKKKAKKSTCWGPGLAQGWATRTEPRALSQAPRSPGHSREPPLTPHNQEGEKSHHRSGGRGAAPEEPAWPV